MADFLETLKSRTVEVEVTLPYGDKITICMGSLTLSEWDSLGESVPQPEGTYVRHNDRGEEIRSYATAEYQKASREAEAERRWKRLTMGMLRGGNAIDGLLFEDQVKRVRETLDSSIATTLMNWQIKSITQGKASVIDRSKRFQPVGTTDPTDDETVEPESADVPILAE